MRRDHGQGRAADASRGRGRPRIHPDVGAAAATIAGRLKRTPLLSSDTLGRAFGGRAFLKAELFQKTGSFKPRGVLTKLASLTQAERERGVVAASAGNHAAALAYGCALEGIDCLVVMWQGASELKRAAAEGYGAAVDQVAAGPSEVFERLALLQEETGRVLVHPFDDPLVVAGQGTVGLEIAEDLPGVDVVVVPVGGGGLVAGIAAALPGVRVVGVEPERAAALHEALAAGAPVPVVPDSVADGLNAPFAGRYPLEVCRRLGVETLLVTEEEIAGGFRFLYERAKLAAEPAGAAGVAALLAGKVAGGEGATVAAVVSGGNVAGETASGILKSRPVPTDS
ncbi:MAG TPA: pyridoxal-phosphate dependent enzyme [Gaiellaceae bacterium]|nr:pyridoxal-phosphate dependent enzyme [Gaiellaceae bacterium]